MTEVYIRYNPYRLTTEIRINGNPITEESSVAVLSRGKRLQKWIGELPQKLRDERGSREFKVIFHGNMLDYDDVKDAFENAAKRGVISQYQTSYEEANGDDAVYDLILKTYNELMDDPYFTDSLSEADRKGLESAIRRVQDNVFPIHVIATMSSGKSTLINALLRQKLMPSRNEACTAIITEILDNDSPKYSAIVYDRSDNQIKTVEQLTYEIMNTLNDNENIARVSVEGNVPFLSAAETRLKLVDTPGPNNARNTNHRETTYKNINSATENMILYILNYTQLSTNDDSNLLHYVAEEIKKGGKETRDRFLFVINKMDEVGEDDSVPHAIEETKAYLAKHGIEDPQIFPCSAFAALGLRTITEDFNDPTVVMKLMANPNLFKLYGIMKQLNEIEDLHLEKYSTLTPSEQEKLRMQLQDAVASNNFTEQALIHSGIYSIESAIRAYVQKYAKAKKIRDFVEPLEEQLHQAEKEAQAKLKALSGGKEAEAIHERCSAVRAMIEKGEDAKRFQSQIEKINPIPEIQSNAKKLIDDANIRLVKRFKHLGEKIEGRQEALNFINMFSDDAAEVLSSLSAQMEILVQQQITETGTRLIEAYQKKLEGFDKSVGTTLDFGTADLVSGVLSRMKKSANDYSSSGSLRKQNEQNVDEVHKDEIEEYTEKVIQMKQVKKKVQDGVERVQTGEERVVVGTHREKVGTRQVKKKGFFAGVARFFGRDSGYEEEAIYEDFEDVEYRPTYDYVPKMKEIIEEIPTVVEETRTKQKYVVPVADLQRKLVMPIRKQLDEDSEELIEAATVYMEQLKKSFLMSFAEIDSIIKQKYAELDEFTNQREALEQRRRECVQMVDFLQSALDEINNALNV